MAGLNIRIDRLLIDPSRVLLQSCSGYVFVSVWTSSLPLYVSLPVCVLVVYSLDSAIHWVFSVIRDVRECSMLPRNDNCSFGREDNV
jgi:hypothetical protein